MAEKSSSISMDSLLSMIPDGDEFNPIRWAIERIQSTFPDELDEITSVRLQGWIDEVLAGGGRTPDEIRDDIFKYVVGAETIMDVLGVDAETAAALIAGKNDGGMNFSDLDIGVGGGVIDEAAGIDPTGIMSGGQLAVLTRDGMDPVYAMAYEVDGIRHVYTFASEDAVYAALGPDAFKGGTLEMSYDEAQDVEAGSSWILGDAAALTFDPDTSYGAYWQGIVDEAALEAGVRNPGLIGAMLRDPDIARIIAQGEAGGWSPERIQAEIRTTPYYQEVLYPGIGTFLEQGIPDPEAAYHRYMNSVAGALDALGYEPDDDGSYRSSVALLLERGIRADEFNQFAPTFVRAQSSQEYADVLNQWVAADTGKEMTFDDWFDVLEGTSGSEMAAIVEKATLQFQAERSGSILSPEQITRLAGLTDFSEAQMASAFTQAEQALLTVGNSNLARYGLSEEALVNSAFGVETLGADPLSTDGSPFTAVEVQRRARKAAQELGIQDDSKAGFFLGFDRFSRPQRQGLAASAPEVG